MLTTVTQNTTGDASINFIDSVTSIFSVTILQVIPIADNTGENLVINGATINLVTGTYPRHSINKSKHCRYYSATADTNLSTGTKWQYCNNI